MTTLSALWLVTVFFLGAAWIKIIKLFLSINRVEDALKDELRDIRDELSTRLDHLEKETLDEAGLIRAPLEIDEIRSETETLSDRIRAVELVENAEFKKNLREAAALPLEKVFWFSLSVGQSFWSDTLKTTPEEIRYARAHGRLLDHVRIKSWKSHLEIAVFEKEWDASADETCLDALYSPPAREIEVYDESHDYRYERELWELPLSPPDFLTFHIVARCPALELRLSLAEWRLRLCALYGRFGISAGPPDLVDPKEENVLLDVPLVPAKLEQFKVPADAEDEITDPWLRYEGEPWDSRYAHDDESRGIGWGLHVLNLRMYRDR